VDIIVMAGRVQLLASGPQEQFFTDNPDYSHFLESFKKHSNFSREYVDLDPVNQIDFGKTVRFKVLQNQGDLLKTLSLKIKLPEIGTSGVAYIESVGHAIVEHADVIIGGKIIQRLTSDYLQIYSEHNVTQSKQNALKHLIGKYEKRTADVQVANRLIVASSALGNTKDVDFFVDLPFYFYNHPELAIPLCAIKKQEVEVEIKLRDVKDLVVRIDGAYPDPFTEDIKIQEFKLCTEIVFLDCTERIKIEKTPRDYLISQLQQNVFNVDAGVNSDTFKLDFSNPVKELYFVIQRRGKIGNNEFQFVTPFDYDNTSAVQDGKYILYENLDHLILTLDGQDIITRETGSVIFLKAVQAAIHHSKTQLIRRFYSYSFALQPEEWYPTGQVNFSLIKEQILNLSMTSCPDFARQLRVYALSYNILRVAEGFSKTLFTVKY
jgi:hypothetical protein